MNERRLKDILINAKRNVKFYADVLGEGIENRDGMELLEQVPIVTKREIKDNIVDFVHTGIDERILNDIRDYQKDFTKEYGYKSEIGQLHVEYTSGTTGNPFFSIKTKEERIQLGRASWYQRRKMAHLNPKKMFCFMHSENKAIDELYRLPLNEQIMFLQQNSFESWHIYPGKLDEYYRYLEQTGTQFKGVDYIECNGAYVSTNERQAYESMFNCKVLNNYGCREVWSIAYANSSDYLDINDNSVYLELLDDQDRPITKMNEIGNICLTSLYLQAMPFIRYKIGDRACFVQNECGEVQLKIEPSRSLIAGTQISGSRLFKEVVLFLNQIFKITEYTGIYVYQNRNQQFEVYVNGYNGDTEFFEDAFIKCFYIVSKFEKKYSFDFRYNQHEGKGIFALKR